jgi:AcrR family transcriptional regulator
MLQADRRTRSTETRDALLEAAAHVFLERGFHGASARQIAERAGFTNPVLYYHFGGKDQLYEALIHGAFERFQTLVRSGLEQAPDAKAGLRAIAAVHLQFAMDDPVRLRVLYAECFQPAFEVPGAVFQDVRDWVSQQFEAVLRAGVTAGEFALADVPHARRLLMALLSGLLMEQARDPRVPVLQTSLADSLVRTFLHGICDGTERE